MASPGSRFQSHRDLAFGMLDRIGEQFAGNEPKGNRYGRRYGQCDPLNGKSSLGSLAERHIKEFMTKCRKELLELDALNVIQRVQMKVNTAERCDTV